MGPLDDVGSLDATAQEHALTWSIRDSAALLDATAGPALGDPYECPPPTRPFAQEVNVPPRPLRIGFTSQTPLGTPVHADCLTALQEAAALCADLGHEVTEAVPAFNAESLFQAYATLVASVGFHGGA